MTEQQNDDVWESYFYPDTDEVLINLKEIKDGDKLKKEEATDAFKKLGYLRKYPLNGEIECYS